MSKKYTTNFLEDTNGSTGSANQVLVSTAAGIDWVDGSGSGIIGGPYLPLAGGTMTGNLNLTYAYPRINLTDTNNDSDYSIINNDGSFGIYDVTNNSYRLSISAAGNVGIGTTAPAAKLHVKEPSGSFSQIKMSASSNEANYGYLTMLDYAANTAKLTFGTTYGYNTPVPAMTVWNGMIGIGTTNPLNKLFVSTSTAGDYAGFIENTNSTNGYGLVARTAHTGTSAYAFAARAGTSDVFVVRGDGNIGIGTTSPDGKLHIHQTGSGTSNSIITEDDARKIFIGRDSIKATDLSNNAAMLYLQQHGGNATFGNDVSLGGNLTLTTNARYLRAEDNAGTTTRLLGINGSNNTYIGPIDAYAGGSVFYGVSANVSSHTLYTGASARLHINSSGNVGIGTTSPNTKLDVISGTNGGIRISATDTTSNWRDIDIRSYVSQAQANALPDGSAIYTTNPTSQTETAFSKYGGTVIQGRDDGNSSFAIRLGNGGGYATRMFMGATGETTFSNTVQASGYKSSDGTAGITGTMSFVDKDSVTRTITYKNGLVVGVTP